MSLIEPKSERKKLSWLERLWLGFMAAVVLTVAGVSALNYFDRALYHNRYTWNPLQTPFGRWERELPVREQGLLVRYDERLNHALIYEVGPESSTPVGKPLSDGKSVIITIGSKELTFEAKGRLVVVDQRANIVKSVPISDANELEKALIGKAMKR